MRNCRPFAMGSAVFGGYLSDNDSFLLFSCWPQPQKTLRGLSCRKFFDWLTVSLVGKTYFPRLRSSPASKISLRSGSLQDVEKVNTRRLAGQKFCGNMHGCKRPMGKPRQAGEVCRFATVFDAPQGLANASRQAKIASFSFLRTCFLRCGLPWHPLCPPANPEIWRSPII